MTPRIHDKHLTALVAVSLLAATPALAQDDHDSPYYEKDAWWDITEWLDGNDYNPTNEKVFAWDDESYSTSYGYDEAGLDDDDWFYDYYDDYYYDYYDGRYTTDTDDSGSYDAFVAYYDLDRDGFCDARSAAYDLDGDGSFETRETYWVGTASGKGAAGEKKAGEKGAQEASAPMSSPSQTQKLKGEMKKLKEVEVRGQKKLVALLDTEQAGEIAVDLGSREGLGSLRISEGDTLTVEGMKTRVGEHQVFLSSMVEMDGKSHQVDRSHFEVSGEVQGTREFPVRGEQHLLAIVSSKTEQGKAMQWLVDLGPVDDGQGRVEKGQTITVQGVPSMRDGKHLLIATYRCEGEDRERIPVGPCMSSGKESKHEDEQGKTKPAGGGDGDGGNR